VDAITGVGSKNEALLADQGIVTVEDLERVHFQLHVADAERTRQFLEDVVGIKNKKAVKNILLFLDPSSSRAASRIDDMMAFEPVIMNILSTYAGLSLERLQNMLLASSGYPKYDKSRDQLAAYMAFLANQGKIVADNVTVETVYRSKDAPLRSPSPMRSSSPSAARPKSPTPARAAEAGASPQGARMASPSVKRASPTPARGPATPRAPSPRAARGKSAAAPTPARGTSKEPASFAKVSEDEMPWNAAPAPYVDVNVFESQVLDILQNYAGADVNRLADLLFISAKEPRYTHGPEKLAGLLERMVAEGKILKEAGVYRYKRRTPMAQRSRSPTPQRAAASLNGNGAAPAGLEGLVLDTLGKYAGLPLERLNNMLRMSGGRYEGGPEALKPVLASLVASGAVSENNGVYKLGRAGSSPAPAPRASSPPPRAQSSSPAPKPSSWSPAPPANVAALEPLVLDLLQNYAGLTMERLTTMLASSPKAKGMAVSSSQLSGVLSDLIARGNVSSDGGVYRFRTKTPAPGRASSPGRAPSAAPAPRAASPAAAAPAPAASSSSGSMAKWEAAALNTLQNYSGLAADRLHAMMTSSLKGQGYAASVGQLTELLNDLVARGNVSFDSGVYRFRTKTPMPGRAGTPAAARPSSPAPAFQPSGAGASSSSSSNKPSADMVKFEPAVLNLLQNYAGLTVERLNGLLSNSPKAPGYKGTVGQLSGLLADLMARGRVESEGGLYRYVKSGATPGLSRSPSPPRSSSPAPSAAKAASPAPAPAPAKSASPAASPAPSSDWAPYEPIMMSVLGNYGALPLERLQESMQAAMVWPRYTKNTAQLKEHLKTLVESRKLVLENGLYRKAGTPQPARPGSPPRVPPAPPSDMAPYEPAVMKLLGAYSGLSLDRLQNMLSVQNAEPKYNRSVAQLRTLMEALAEQGKVTVSQEGIYSAAGAKAAAPASPARSPSPAPGGARAPSAPPLELDADLLRKMGFPTGQGMVGFNSFAEVANGRLAMLGFVSCMAVEFKSDLGTLEQVGFSGLPSMDLVYLILGAVGASSALGALVTGARYATGNMPAPEVEQYRRFFTLQPQELVDDAVFPTPELKYARGVELSNGRAAMLGFLAGLVMEALTGHGVIGQVVIYLKLAGLLGEKSGF